MYGTTSILLSQTNEELVYAWVKTSKQKDEGRDRNKKPNLNDENRFSAKKKKNDENRCMDIDVSFKVWVLATVVLWQM